MYSENSISKKLQTFAEKNDWLISGAYIYGDEQGYLFSGLDGKGEKTFITPVPGITEDQQTELFEILEKNKVTMKLTEYAVTDDFLCIRIKDSLQLKTDDLEFIIALLVGSLQEVAVVTVGRCQECGEMGAEKEDFVYDLYCYMHENCAKAFADEMKEAASKSDDNPEDDNPEDDNADSDDSSEDSAGEFAEETGIDTAGKASLLKKVLFTLAGAVVGSIPWLLLPYIMDFINGLLGKITTSALVTNFTQSLLTCLCAYLVSFLAIFGYRLSKAKMDKKGRWIVGIVSIAVVVLLQFAYIAVLIIKEPTVSFTLTNYLTNMSKSAFYINMLLGALIGTVFTLISVLPFFDTSISSSRAKKGFLAKNNSADKPDASEETGSDEEKESEMPEEAKSDVLTESSDKDDHHEQE